MANNAGFFRSQLIWIYTVCKGRVYPSSAGQGLIYNLELAMKMLLFLERYSSLGSIVLNPVKLAHCVMHGDNQDRKKEIN